MNINIRGLNINYEVSGEGKTIILLHGWLCSLETMKPLQLGLEKNFKVYNIDLPGFGNSDKLSNPYCTNDFGDFLDEFINKLKLDNPILIGHSNGGRTILNYAGRTNKKINKIVLIDSGGIKPDRKVDYYIKIYTFKILKNILKLCPSTEMFNNIRERVLGVFGSSDYKSSSEVLKRTMSIIINEDQTENIKNINVPTLILWGENDEDTPLKDGIKIEENIKNSSLIKIKDAGHFSYIDKYSECITIIKGFLVEE